MTECCSGCKHGKDGKPHYGGGPCITCSEYPYESQYEPEDKDPTEEGEK